MNKELENLLKNLSDVLDAEDASLFLVRNTNPDSPFEIISAGRKNILEDLTIPRGEGIVGWVFEHRLPVISNDAEKDERFYDIVDMIIEGHTKSILAVPINYEGRVIGVIEVVNKLGDTQFTEADISKVTETANAILSHIPQERLNIFKESGK